jgi:hypothetical protein
VFLFNVQSHVEMYLYKRKRNKIDYKKMSGYGPISSVYNDLIDICVITGANLIHFSVKSIVDYAIIIRPIIVLLIQPINYPSQ